MRPRRKKPAATCQLCGEPATQFKESVPWPGGGSRHRHKSYTCDAHASYLDGVIWSKRGDGDWEPVTTFTTSCAYCPAPYGQCEHSRDLAAKFNRWEAQAKRGRLAH